MLLAAAAVSTGASPATGAGSAASWRLHQLDRDRCWDAETMDADLNGYTEDIRYDADNDCRWDARVWNSVGRDSFLESMTFDMNEDGRWEYWLADNDQQEAWDVAHFDDNADGRYDRWACIPRAPTSSLLEAIWRVIRAARCEPRPTRTETGGPITSIAARVIRAIGNGVGGAIDSRFSFSFSDEERA